MGFEWLLGSNLPMREVIGKSVEDQQKFALKFDARRQNLTSLLHYRILVIIRCNGSSLGKGEKVGLICRISQRMLVLQLKSMTEPSKKAAQVSNYVSKQFFA